MGRRPRVVRALTVSFQGAIGAFVRNGTPNAPGVPAWAPYGLEQRATMRYDTVTECVGDLSGGQRALQYLP